MNLDPFIFFCYFLRRIWDTTDVLMFVFFSGMDVPPFGVIECLEAYTCFHIFLDLGAEDVSISFLSGL
jgi:hypothetical protein